MTNLIVLTACRDNKADQPLPQVACPGIFVQEAFPAEFTLLSILPGGPLPAIMDCISKGKGEESRRVLSHERLAAFLTREFPAMLQVSARQWHYCCSTNHNSSRCDCIKNAHHNITLQTSCESQSDALLLATAKVQSSLRAAQST